MVPIPVTVFTGFLGSGKTTIILELLKSLPKGYSVVVLKNEFGNSMVDSKLLSTQAIQVKEITNGCLCCVLVGQMKNALEELALMNPDRIIIETSGSAFPAPIAWQIRQLPSLVLDAIVTVVDCVNFAGYEDTSYTAKMQAQYTDLILLSKHQLVSERELEIVIDKVNDLNTDTPKIKWTDDAHSLVFGIDSALFMVPPTTALKDHHAREVDLIEIHAIRECSQNAIESLLAKLSKEYVYRVKGLLPINGKRMVLNWAFERYTLEAYDDADELLITVMGVDLAFSVLSLFEAEFGKQNLEFHPAK